MSVDHADTLTALHSQLSSFCCSKYELRLITLTEPHAHVISAHVRQGILTQTDPTLALIPTNVIPQNLQGLVFDEVSPLVRSCADGFNVCIFAYGQTGSGKTHTMEGSSDSPGECLSVLVTQGFA